MIEQKIIIAGPCATESRKQIRESVKGAIENGVQLHRTSLWKPRTEPAWDGIGSKKGTPIMLDEVVGKGLTPATEVIHASHALSVIKAIRKIRGSERLNGVPNAVLWIGARNGDHLNQQGIGRAVAAHPDILVGVKNPMEADERGWKGRVAHVLSGGASKEQILLIHRGFFDRDERSLRNTPDFNMAMRVKKELGLPMLIDPSHIGGSVENVIRITKEAMAFRDKETGVGFDGLILEVHPEPHKALTDAKQQLTWSEFSKLRVEADF